MKLNQIQLKEIAMITMLIDHIGFLFFPNEMLFRVIGRVAFILYAYMVVEAIKYSHDTKKYLFKLFILAIISEIPYNLFNANSVLYPEGQNVIFTLLIGGITCHILRRNPWSPYISFWIIIGVLLPTIIVSDYIAIGVFLMIAFFYSKTDGVNALSVITFCLLEVAFAFIFNQAWYVYLGGLLSIPLLLSYKFNHDLKPSKYFKWLYWGFYPLHMLVLWAVKVFA